MIGKLSIKDVITYCEKYDVPIEHLVEVISDLKVIPMIRGKALEFATEDRLKSILNQKKWRVKHLLLNPQLGFHDIDVSVERIADGKKVKVECKLAKNNSFKLSPEGRCKLNVKCMRSRTVGDTESATRMARIYGIPREIVLIHADNYRASDFDCVVTSIGNAFWGSEDTGNYVFNGTREQFNALKSLFPQHFTIFKNFQKDVYNFLLVALSKNLCVCPANRIECKRRKCRSRGTHNDCGFIPNYPLIDLNEVADGTSIWKPIDNVEDVFNIHLS